MLDETNTALEMLEPGRLTSRRRGLPDNEKIQPLVDRLASEASKRMQQRTTIEKRMLEDLQLFHGEHSAKTQQRLDQNNGSQLNVNLVRVKTNTAASRFIDLMFPTDDRHWGIRPTPVPEMDKGESDLKDELALSQLKASKADAAFAQAAQQTPLDEGDEVPEVIAQAGMAQDEANAEVDAIQAALDELHEERTEAIKRAELMQDEIDDQLKACRYQSQCRRAIYDAYKLGTGILKGPIQGERTRRRWQSDEQGHALTQSQDIRPAFERVDPWNFYPDMGSRYVEDCEGFFELHMMNKKQLRKLALRPDIDKGAINELLKTEPGQSPNDARNTLFSMSGDETHKTRGKYQVWEYTGPVEPEELASLVDVYEDELTAQSMQEFDLVDEINVRIWFCGSEVLSFALHQLDSGEPIYSIFNYDPSETNLFGYGVPRVARDPALAYQAAWRAMMDNGRAASGPQIIVDKKVIEPAGGGSDYTIRPMKVWNAKTGAGNGDSFRVVHIEVNQAYLANIIQMAAQAIDDVTGIPPMAQGEPGTMSRQTATGMAILSSNANIMTKRIVKAWDDSITTPNIRRIYDFNMQFSDKEEIKGDYEIDARGTSVLFAREIAAPNLLSLAMSLGENPRYADRIDDEGMLEELFKANSIPTPGILLTKGEFDKAQEERAKANAPDPMIALKERELEVREREIEARTAIAEMETASRRHVADRAYEADMAKFTETVNLKDEERQDRNEDRDAERDHKKQALAIEVGMVERTGKSAGGSV